MKIANKPFNQNNEIKSFLEKRYSRTLSSKEIADHKNKLVNFFSLLIEIDQQNKKKEKIKEKVNLC